MDDEVESNSDDMYPVEIEYRKERKGKFEPGRQTEKEEERLQKKRKLSL
jgi:hypothetical protein